MEVRRKAVRAMTAMVAGGHHTVLVSYFIYRDFFPALMKVCSIDTARWSEFTFADLMQLTHELESPLQAFEPLLLIGLLANYSKFEVHNQYRVRFSDFAHERAMNSVVEAVGWISTLLRERYVAVQDDRPTTWSLSGTLSQVGLGYFGATKSAAPSLTEEQQRELFFEQYVGSPQSLSLALTQCRPGLEASVMLMLYDFVMANKVFCRHFITSPSPGKDHHPPFSTFISLSSYMYQHAHRTARASAYAFLSLLVYLILVEDSATVKLLCETVAPMRLCRQRPPHLPPTKAERTYASSIIDLLVDGMNHNLRKRLDTNFYICSLKVLSRVLAHLAKTRTLLEYHWSELWRSLLSFVRFLTTYAEDLKSRSHAPELVQAVVRLLSFTLTAGETFLPDTAAYDDLFYKLVESGDSLIMLRNVYQLGKTDETRSHIQTLIGVSTHYRELIDSEGAKPKQLLPQDVMQIIKKGYETLSFEPRDGDGPVETYREMEHKSTLKGIARVVVADAARFVAK